jgi:N-acetylglucosaminyl-diphospho-decaprenol L-rhamnosyltransferase
MLWGAGEEKMSAQSESSTGWVGGRKAKLIDEAVAVVIVNYRTSTLTRTCLAGLENERTVFRNLQVLVVDGGSDDGSAEELRACTERREFRDWVELLPLPLNGGFGWANNQAIHRLMARREQPRYIHLLNPDTEIEHGAVTALAEYLNDHPRAAAVGSQLLDSDGSWSGSAFRFPSIRGEFSRGAHTELLDRLFRIPPVAIETSAPIEVDWVTGASVMFRLDALRQVGLFDEGFFLYHEETELMWRMRKAGWTIATEPRSRVRHIGGSITGVHDRQTAGQVKPRKPAYLYRSRTRFFGLTRGRAVATVAYAAWLAGHGILSMRRLLGLARAYKPVDYQFRDHVVKAFPRKHDFVTIVTSPDASPSAVPAWMEKRWL